MTTVWTEAEERAALHGSQRSNLPDSAFAYIEPGGTKEDGKTRPDSLRHFPIHDAAHVRNALARIAQGAKFGDKALPKVRAAAKRFGVAVGDGDSDDRARSRPDFELLKRRRNSMIRQPERRGLLLEMRSKPDGTGGTDFVFEGYAAIFDAPFEMWDKWGDSYTEIVRPGAFTRSLQRRDLDVPFLIGHDDKRLALARTRNGTMQLSQDSRGMLVRATMDGRRSDVRDLAYAVERGDNDEMSIGFVTLGQEWSADYETRNMLDLDIHRGDVSSVPLAANPAAAGASMTEITSRRPPGGEQLANAVARVGDAPDYDPWPHAAAGTIRCANAACPVDGGAMNHPDARFCDQCGSPVGGDALVRVNDDGVPGMTEEHGESAQLALRRRRLELLQMGHRDG